MLAEGDAAGLHTAGLILDLLLAGGLTAPHSLDVAGLGSGDLQKLLVVVSDVGLLGQILLTAGNQLVVHLIQHSRDLGLHVVQGHEALLAGHAADQHAGVVLDVAGADLQTDERYWFLVVQMRL